MAPPIEAAFEGAYTALFGGYSSDILQHIGFKRKLLEVVSVRGHVFCSFLALVLRKALQTRCDAAGLRPEWGDASDRRADHDPADTHQRRRRTPVPGRARCPAAQQLRTRGLIPSLARPANVWC